MFKQHFHHRTLTTIYKMSPADISEDAKKKREKEQRTTTIILLFVSFAFLVFHMAFAVYNCFSLCFEEMTSKEERASWDFVNSLGLTMMELQNSVHFTCIFLQGDDIGKSL